MVRRDRQNGRSQKAREFVTRYATEIANAAAAELKRRRFKGDWESLQRDILSEVFYLQAKREARGLSLYETFIYPVRLAARSVFSKRGLGGSRRRSEERERDELAAGRSAPTEPEDYIDPTSSREGPAAEAHLRLFLKEVIGKLPALTALVIYKRWEGFTWRECGAALGRDRSSLARRVQAARAALGPVVSA